MKPQAPPWPEAMATVTACHYDAGAGRAMAFGIPTRRHFQITFNYWVTNSDGTAQLQTGEFSSEKAMPQGTIFPIHYNPDAPHETRTAGADPLTSGPNPVLAIALIGSALLALAWLVILRGCR